MPENTQALIEGLLFMAGEDGLSLLQIQSVMQDLSRQEIQQILEKLMELSQSPERGVELVCYASRYKYVSKPDVYPLARQLFEEIKVVSLSPAAMETLAVIAYKQPITRVEIEAIRGVSCDLMLKKLMARDLIEAKSRLDTVGKPLLYTVTDTFLDTFQLDSLDQLPKLETREEKDLFEQS